MWVVRVDDDVYVRSAHGPDNGWYRRAVASGTGRIRAGGVEHDVDLRRTPTRACTTTSTPPTTPSTTATARIVDGITNDEARATTLRLVPRP